MGKFSDKSNSEIILELQSMKQEHEAIKAKILKELDNLDKVEKDFNEANIELKSRLTGNNE